MEGLDYAAIDFPSDRLTIGMLRRRCPLSVPTAAEERSPDSLVAAISGMLELERLLVDKAYAAAARVPDPHVNVNRKSLIGALSHEYRLFGLSSGERATKVLIEQIEDVASEQVRKR